MIKYYFVRHLGGALALLGLGASVASAATSFSNPLTGFTGDSTQTATQNAVLAAGFNFSDTIVPVNFNAGGAFFGVGLPNNDGRNYMRTVDSDYSKVSFVSEVSFVAPDIDNQDAYFGLGAGDAIADNFRLPDFNSPNSSIMFFGETEVATPSIEISSNDNGQFRSTFIDPTAGLGNGTHRVRLSYDWFAKAATFAFDLNYAGGPFTADFTAAPMNVLALYGADGWHTEPGRVFFGGDEGVAFKDFSVNVTSPANILGDFNSSGTVNGLDWAILRNNQHTDLSAKTAQEAYFLGDLNVDKANNHDDFVMFKILYDDANGAGAFVEMLAGVPEPSSALLLASAAIASLSWRRRFALRS